MVVKRSDCERLTSAQVRLYNHCYINDLLQGKQLLNDVHSLDQNQIYDYLMVIGGVNVSDSQ